MNLSSFLKNEVVEEVFSWIIVIVLLNIIPRLSEQSIHLVQAVIMGAGVGFLTGSKTGTETMTGIPSKNKSASETIWFSIIRTAILAVITIVSIAVRHHSELWHIVQTNKLSLPTMFICASITGAAMYFFAIFTIAMDNFFNIKNQP